MAGIRRINESLAQKAAVRDSRKPSKDEDETGTGSFRVPLKEGSLNIAFDSIYFIAVEDHYCRFVINREGALSREYVRLSLKEAMAGLPAGRFARVHRSYVVNLQHVKHIQKVGQAYQLAIEGCDNLIPASRHRARSFLPMLKELLN